jgi:hypothetical protein
LSEIPDRLRAEVVARAGSVCEYCLTPAQGQVAWFPIDHIVPRSGGGQTEWNNLALACPRCNAHKWAFQWGTDTGTGNPAPLFHPRQQSWAEHFRWSEANDLEIEGLTPCGRATVERLKMNDPEIVAIRRLLVRLGIQIRHYKGSAV